MSTKHVLWAAGLDGPAAYSIDGGNSWVEVSTESITPTVWSVDAWSPKNALKVYSQFDEFEGIWYYSSGTWHPEFPAFDTLVFARNPQRSALWCAEDDSLVVAVNWSWIRQRLGPPGTAWTEQDYSPEYGTNQFWDVHGLPDGSAVYTANTEDTAGPNDVHLLKLAGGVWTPTVIATVTPPETMTVRHIRAISETEVWLAGYYYLGGAFDPYFYKIWKWDGAVLTEEWSSEPNEGRLDGFPTFHMAEDGSEGWAVLRVWSAPSMKYLRFDGAVWTSSAAVDYGVEPQSITQIDGDTSSARLLLSDNTVVAYDGAVWSPLATAPPLGGDALTLRYFQVPWIDPITTYWANVKDGTVVPNPSIHAYSIDGAASFVSAGRPDVPDDHYTELVYGPKTLWKFYFLFGSSSGAGDGVWCYDPLGWHKELDVLTGTVLKNHAGIWCNEDDTYAVIVMFGGPGTGGIHERVGPAGTPWDYIPHPYYSFEFVHGVPDGSAVFAIGGVAAELWRRDPVSGVWGIVDIYSAAWNIDSLFVVSDTEVWFAAMEGTTLRIVRWDGVGFNVEFSKTYGGAPGQTTVWGFYMAEDGSEGWAVVGVDYVPTNEFIHYDGANWSVVQSAPYSSEVAGVTQVDGAPSSAKIMLRDGSIRSYDGATWDTTYSGTSLIPGMSASIYFTVRSFDLFAVGSPPYLANLDPAEGETGVCPNAQIILDVLDAEGDLNPASVVIEIGGVIAWSGDAQQNGFVVSKTAQPNGLRYTITPPEFLSPGTTVVEVYAEDLA